MAHVRSNLMIAVCKRSAGFPGWPRGFSLETFPPFCLAITWNLQNKMKYVFGTVLNSNTHWLRKKKPFFFTKPTLAVSRPTPDCFFLEKEKKTTNTFQRNVYTSNDFAKWIQRVLDMYNAKSRTTPDTALYVAYPTRQIACGNGRSITWRERRPDKRERRVKSTGGLSLPGSPATFCEQNKMQSDLGRLIRWCVAYGIVYFVWMGSLITCLMRPPWRPP